MKKKMFQNVFKKLLSSSRFLENINRYKMTVRLYSSFQNVKALDGLFLINCKTLNWL